MLRVKEWNKKDKINGINAEQIMREQGINEHDDIFLVIDNADNVTEIQFKNIICGIFDINVSLSTQEVAEEYLRIMTEEKAVSYAMNHNTNDLAERCLFLEEENKKIKNILKMLLTEEQIKQFEL